MVNSRLKRVVSAIALAVAVLMISGFGAADAHAAVECPSIFELGSGGIRGAGTEYIGQREWTGREPAFGEPYPALPYSVLLPRRGYARECEETPVSFNQINSLNTLRAFRFTGEGSIEHDVAYLSADFAPRGNNSLSIPDQIENAEKATYFEAKPLVIPVAQTTIAVVVHPPSGCSLTFNSTHGFKWEELGKVFGGAQIKQWSDFSNDSGGSACEQPITRVLRGDPSGTALQFKNYLALLAERYKGAPQMPCALWGDNEAEESYVLTSEWANMKAITIEGIANDVWPTPSNCEGTTNVAEVWGSDKAVARYVEETPGTIGLASLPEAKGTGVSVAWLQNANGITKSYAPPEAREGTSSNCGPRIFYVPKPGRVGESGESVNWSTVFGAKPEIGGGRYPLCVPIYVYAWSNYAKAGFSYPVETANVVKDYVLNYILNAGQSASLRYEEPLAGEEDPEWNDIGAAKLAASKIGSSP
jgi:ABC-type phosphate transport system substrate-binding protein